MSSPDVKRSSQRERAPAPRRPSFLSNYQDDLGHNPLPTRSGALASLIRTRSASSLSSKYGGARDEEAGGVSANWRHGEDDDIAKLLANEQRLSQILNGAPQARSMNLIGKSNPRYRWEQYWKRDDELKTMTRPV